MFDVFDVRAVCHKLFRYRCGVLFKQLVEIKVPQIWGYVLKMRLDVYDDSHRHYYYDFCRNDYYEPHCHDYYLSRRHYYHDRRRHHYHSLSLKLILGRNCVANVSRL